MGVQHQFDDDPTKHVRLIIDIVPELQRRIRTAAAENDLSIEEYVEYVLEQTVPAEKGALARENRGLNRAAVDRLLRHHEELKRAHAGEGFEDSVELLRQAREDRTRELER